MATRNLLKSVATNFLAAYASRHTEYQGYWLFGFLAGVRQPLEIVLLGDKPVDGPLLSARAGLWRTPPEAATGQAWETFDDQLAKAGLERSAVESATFTLSTVSEQVEALVGGRLRRGHDMRLEVCIVAADGRQYQAAETKFVALHDPQFEVRSQSAAT